ncbi:MAG: hypothetical protein IT375_07475 [Polyangiaceae bacterium]|nr:hypothetical protein [Polyangiaceae bacterium]
MSGQLVAELASRVLLPLMAGGELRPLPPIGHQRALAVAEHGAFASTAIDEVRARRIRVARRLCAVDVLPDPSAGEWLMVCALNDLLQSANPSLLGVFGADRPQRLLDMAHDTVHVAGPPKTIGEALARHATFSRMLEVVRVDTHVSFWVGRRVYRGAKPPSRITRWRDVRRVSERQESVRLAEMTPVSPAATPRFEATLQALIAASPLTDLATATRQLPVFRWSGAALSLVSSGAGRALVLRALERVRAQKTLVKALSDVPDPVRRGVTPDAARAGSAVAELLGELDRRLALAAAVSDSAAVAARASAGA